MEPKTKDLIMRESFGGIQTHTHTQNKDSHVKREAGTRVMCTSQEVPRIAGHHQKLREARKDSSLEPVKGASPC